MTFYRIKGRELTRWGDYGHMLQHGMTAHLARDGGKLRLERTGPYIPAITFPGIGDIVVTSAGKALLESSPLTGFSFQPVTKTRIVNLPWHEWDLTTEEPPHLPESGEPEDYILEREPDARAALEIGDVWELVVPVTAVIGRARRIVSSYHELHVELSSWNGSDFFRGDGLRGALVTHRAKCWLEDCFQSYVAFEEFNCK